MTVTDSLLGDEEPEGALAVLRRFRNHPDLGVRRQLVGTWGRFDAVEYAAEVLDRLDRAELHLSCGSSEQLAALAGMRPWHELSLQGGHRMADILAAVPRADAVTSLQLSDNPRLTDLGSLLAFGSLHRLWIHDCPAADGLDRLSALPLSLFGCSGIGDLTGLRALRSLTRISLSRQLPGTDLTDTLPPDAPLEFLFLGAHSTDGTGLRGVQHWTGLKTLSLGPLTTDVTAADWRAVSELPELTRLSERADHPGVPAVHRTDATAAGHRGAAGRLDDGRGGSGSSGAPAARTAFGDADQPGGALRSGLPLRGPLPGRGNEPGAALRTPEGAGAP